MSRWAGTLITEANNPRLDLAPYVGQRSMTYTYELIDNTTGLAQTVNPVRDTVPVLSHNTDRTIKRQISGLALTVADTAKLNTITSRLRVTASLDGVNYPLGTYMPDGQFRFTSTGGVRSMSSFYDLGFIVDQQLSTGFGSKLIFGVYEQVSSLARRLLADLPVDFEIAASPFQCTFSWPPGTRRGYIVDQLATDGDYFPPWFDNNSIMQWIRTFDPSVTVPRFNFDAGAKVIRDSIIESDDLITAPNRFVVISNGVSSVGLEGESVMGTYDVPSSAPHSIANRGFVVPQVEMRQLNSLDQANAVARGIGQREIVYEVVELYTAPDPRHDSYDVIRWQGENWLELAWSLPLVEGARMQHIMRKAYS